MILQTLWIDMLLKLILNLFLRNKVMYRVLRVINEWNALNKLLKAVQKEVQPSFFPLSSNFKSNVFKFKFKSNSHALVPISYMCGITPKITVRCW